MIEILGCVIIAALCAWVCTAAKSELERCSSFLACMMFLAAALIIMGVGK